MILKLTGMLIHVCTLHNAIIRNYGDLYNLCDCVSDVYRLPRKGFFTGVYVYNYNSSF